MNRPALYHGILFAVGISILGTTLFSALSALFPVAFALKLVLIGLVTGYQVYLSLFSESRTGKFCIGVFTLSCFCIALLLGFSLNKFLLLSLGVIWGTRVILSYSSALMALADGCLCMLGLAAAFWGYAVSPSLLVTLWCFFLVQSLHSLIPKKIGILDCSDSSMQKSAPKSGNNKFGAAYDSAQFALRQIANRGNW